MTPKVTRTAAMRDATRTFVDAFIRDSLRYAPIRLSASELSGPSPSAVLKDPEVLLKLSEQGRFQGDKSGAPSKAGDRTARPERSGLARTGPLVILWQVRGFSRLMVACRWGEDPDDLS